MRSGWIVTKSTKPKPGKARGETRYLARIEHPSDPLSGKRVVESKTFRTKDAAQRWLSGRAAEINAPDYVTPSTATLGEQLAYWLNTHDLAPTSRARYEQVIRLRILPALGRVRLCDLTPRHIQALYQASRGRSDAQQLTAIINGALALAVQERLLARNPALGLHVPRPAEADDAPEPVVWSPAEVAGFLASIEGQWHALFHTLAYTGLRLAEITALRWEDLDLEQGTLTVRRRHKTASGKRVVAMDSRTAAVLAEQRARVDGPLVFARPDGRPLAHRSIQAYLDRAIARLELPRITPHGLRHTLASIAAGAGVPLTMIQQTLGHSSPAITANYYVTHTARERAVVTETFATLVAQQDAAQAAETFAALVERHTPATHSAAAEGDYSAS